MSTTASSGQSRQKNLRQSTPHGIRIHYERRRPEQTILYQLVQEQSMLKPSLRRLRLKPDQGYPTLSKMNLLHFLNVAF